MTTPQDENPVNAILSRLSAVKESGNGWVAQCSGHEDQHASLSIAIGDDGRILVKCFAGCTAEQIVSALGLTLADLFSKNGKEGGGGNTSSPKPFECSNSPGLTLAEYSASKQLPLGFLKENGLSDFMYNGSKSVRFEYRDSNGQLAAVRFRIAMRGDRFRWRRNDKIMLYGLSRLQEAKEKGYLILNEGESDPLTLWSHGEPGAGFPGAGNWKEPWADYLDGIEIIYLTLEPDLGGETVRRWLAKSRIRSRVKILDLGKHKDISALYLDNPAEFRQRLQEILKTATSWSEIEQREQTHAAREAYALSKTLLNAPDLFDQIGATMQARGYAGNLNPPKLAYLGFTSRRLERPLNQAFVSPSGAGKNRTVDAASELMPPEAIYTEKAGSARALIYAEEDFQHKTVIISEADSIPEDGPAASAIRSLAADNFMAYDVVEKNPKTNKFETRHIVKPGPTGLMTTSTKSLRAQMGTRVMEIPVPDDTEQTRAVMRAHAKSVQPGKATAVDLTAYIALQRWLALSGSRRVAVPFANTLADLVPPHAVRMRRDFRQLLTSIQAIALLYQCQRAKTPEGWIIATLDDYTRARELLAPIFDSVLSEGVTPVIRQTVEAIKDGEEVTEAALAQLLKLSKSTVHYRISRALRGGWIINTEQRKGYPAKLSRGTPLPDQVAALPTPDQVKEVFEGSNGYKPGPESFEHPESEEQTATYGEAFDGSNENGKRETPPPPSSDFSDAGGFDWSSGAQKPQEDKEMFE